MIVENRIILTTINSKIKVKYLSSRTQSLNRYMYLATEFIKRKLGKESYTIVNKCTYIFLIIYEGHERLWKAYLNIVYMKPNDLFSQCQQHLNITSLLNLILSRPPNSTKATLVILHAFDK